MSSSIDSPGRATGLLAIIGALLALLTALPSGCSAAKLDYNDVLTVTILVDLSAGEKFWLKADAESRPVFEAKNQEFAITSQPLEQPPHRTSGDQHRTAQIT